MQAALDRILITGATGMVGSYADFGIKTDRRSLDVTDFQEIINFCERHKPQAIIHLAAETDVDRCERDPEYAYLVNGIGTYNIAMAAKAIGAKVVYVSTAGVFDGSKTGPYTEEDEPNPQNYYGRSKYLGELVLRGLLKNYIIARVCWMFGGGPGKDQKFVAKIINQLNNQEVMVVDDQIGSPTFGKDLTAVIKTLLVEDKVGIFNLANQGFCSRYEFACEIAKILKPSARVIPVKSNFFKLDAIRGANESLISKLQIMRPWQAALKEYLETEWKK